MAARGAAQRALRRDVVLPHVVRVPGAAQARVAGGRPELRRRRPTVTTTTTASTTASTSGAGTCAGQLALPRAGHPRLRRLPLLQRPQPELRPHDQRVHAPARARGRRGRAAQAPRQEDRLRTNGCLDGVSQTSFSRWEGPEVVCDICPWRDRPDICSRRAQSHVGGEAQPPRRRRHARRQQPRGLQRRPERPRRAGVLLPGSRRLAPGPGRSRRTCACRSGRRRSRSTTRWGTSSRAPQPTARTSSRRTSTCR